MTITLGASPACRSSTSKALRRFSKQCDRVATDGFEADVVTAVSQLGAKLGELTGYGLGQFQLVRMVRDSLQDSAIQPMPDWVSSVSDTKNCGQTQGPS